MKVYVSMSSADTRAARKIMDKVRAAGHTVVHDWTASVDKTEAGCSLSQSSAAKDDIDAVVEADLLLIYGEPTAGCELGAALAWGLAVVWIMPQGAAAHTFLKHDGVLWIMDEYLDRSGLDWRTSLRVAARYFGLVDKEVA
jgi:hypothetical protein